MVHDYAEDFLESMKIVAEYCYKDQKFDETIIATIINDNDSKNGRYIVTDGTIKFDAYSDSQTYKVNDVVRVTILKGDYSAKKYIVGKSVVEDTGTALSYQSPSDNVLIIADGLFQHPQNKTEWQLRANSKIAADYPGSMDDTKEAYCLWKVSLQDEEFKSLQQSSLYDAIVLKAKFKTLFNGYHMTSGSYGLWLDLYISTSNTGDGVILKRYYLDSSTMFGDPYNFLIPSLQEAKFNIEHTETIKAMALWVYQDNNFKYRDDSGQEKEFMTKYGYNIFISGIDIGMGSDLSNIEENKVTIYTQDSLNYNIENDTQNSNNKQLGLLWYNKDDKNQYIGFSDGYAQKIITEDEVTKTLNCYQKYDEIDYLNKKQNSDRLLLEQNKFDVPNDELGLTLAANLTDLQKLFKQAKKLIFTNLANEMQSFENQLQLAKNADINKEFENWNGSAGWFTTTGQEFEDNEKLFVQYYKESLAYSAAAMRKDSVYDQENAIIHSPVQREDGSEETITYKWPDINLSSATMRIKGILQAVNEQGGLKRSLLTIQSVLLSQLSNFASIYDSYEYKINNIFIQISTLLAEINKLTENIAVGQEHYGQNPAFRTLQAKAQNTILPNGDSDILKTYEAPDYSQYDNLYCIYWYKYVAGYNSIEPFSELNWQRINDQLFKNRGLPPFNDEDVDDSIDIMYPAKPEDANSNDILMPVTLDANLDEEKYKAIIIYNHEPFKSNEIVFTNERPIVQDIVLNNIELEHSTNSQDAYPFYGTNNQLLNRLEYNRVRQVQVRYKDKDGNIDDMALDGAQIYWYLPLNATMLRYDLADYEAIDSDLGPRNAFTNDIGKQPVDESTYREGYACFYKKLQITEDNKHDLQFPYRIKDNFVPTYTNNTIYCVVIKGQIKLETFISLSFSSFGTNGTNYTLVISPKTSQIGMTEDKAFEFKVDLYDYNHDKVTINSDMACTVKLQTINPYEGNITTNINPIIHPVLQFDVNSCMGSVTFGTWARYAYYYVLEAEVKVPWLDGNVTLKTQYPVPYAAQSNYYIEGPSIVIYDSFGANPAYYKQSFKLFEQKINENGVVVSEEISSTDTISRKWEMRYYTKKSSNDSVVDRDFSYVSNLTENLGSYLPILNKENILIPSPMYLINGSNEIYIVAIYFEEKKSGDQVTSEVLWAQPILLQQNCYPSELLNNWNGKLKIDEKGNYLLANMVGAGRKNTDNTFSGVLMGTIGQTANIDVDNITQETVSLNNDHTGTGLYGFYHGKQSFGFNINGTAFLGKSNGGRIAFDGNHGFIYSQNWLNSFKDANGKYTDPFNRTDEVVTLKQGTAGMAIDLQNGHIDAYNFKLTSAGIQLNSDPDKDKKENYFLIGNKDENDNTYLEYSANGDLIMRVNEFQLTSVMGGPNLLHNTAPKETPTLTTDGDNGQASDPIELDHWWREGILKVGERDNKRWILLGDAKEYIDNGQIKYRRQLIQKLDGTIGNLDPYNIYFTKGKYILSGLLYSKIGKRQLTFRLGHWSNPNSQVHILPIGDSGYYEIKLIFNITADDVEQIFQIIDTSNDNVETSTWFHHLKLEKGTIATDWSQSELDIKNYADAMDNVSQETVFNRLTNNGTTQGIILQDGKLYINATYINSGALTVKKGSATLFSADIEKQEVNVAGWIANSGTAPQTFSDRKFLFIGDSYGAGVNAYTKDKDDDGIFDSGNLLGYGWPYYLAARIWNQKNSDTISKLEKGQSSTRYIGASTTTDLKWMAVCQGGAGFANASKFNSDETYSFADLIENAQTILNDIALGEITDIVVGGGWNDMWYDRREPEKNEIKSGIKKFVDKASIVCTSLKRIMVFGIGTCSNSYFVENNDTIISDNVDKQRAEIVLNEMYQKYSDAISDLNNVYNNIDIQFIDIHSFSSNDTVFSTDHVHPVEEGLGMIANEMDYYIRGGNNSRLYNNRGGYNSDLQGFYLSNIPSDYWAIQIGPKNADFSAVGGTKDTLHRPFLVSQSGVLWAQGAHITGNIVATSGNIGGWIITSTGISKSTVISESPKKYYWTTIQPPKGQELSNETFLAVQHYNDGTSEWPFYVRHDGTLHAEKGSIGGITIKSSGGLSGTGWSLTSGGGTIGGWIIDNENGLSHSAGAKITPNSGFNFVYNDGGAGQDAQFYFNGNGLTLNSGSFQLSWGNLILSNAKATIQMLDSDNIERSLTGDLIKKLIDL